MSIGNPELAVKGTIGLRPIHLRLGRNAANWSISSELTVSVVAALNLSLKRIFFRSVRVAADALPTNGEKLLCLSEKRYWRAKKTRQ